MINYKINSRVLKNAKKDNHFELTTYHRHKQGKATLNKTQ